MFTGDDRAKGFINRDGRTETDIVVQKDQGQARIVVLNLRDGSTLPGYGVGAEQIEASLRRVLFGEGA